MFVNTAKGSIIATFRLSSEKAAKELWEMYTEGKFESTLQEVLVENTLKEDQKVPEKPMELKLSLGEDRFHQIQKKLAGKWSNHGNDLLKPPFKIQLCIKFKKMWEQIQSHLKFSKN